MRLRHLTKRTFKRHGHIATALSISVCCHRLMEIASAPKERGMVLVHVADKRGVLQKWRSPAGGYRAVLRFQIEETPDGTVIRYRIGATTWQRVQAVGATIVLVVAAMALLATTRSWAGLIMTAVVVSMIAGFQLGWRRLIRLIANEEPDFLLLFLARVTEGTIRP